MLAKDILGLVVRIFGLILMACGTYSMFFAGVQTLGIAAASPYPYMAHLCFGFIQFVLGYFMVRKAVCIENFCYPSNKKQD